MGRARVLWRTVTATRVQQGLDCCPLAEVLESWRECPMWRGHGWAELGCPGNLPEVLQR